MLKKPPESTYRIQLSAQLGLEAAAALAGYLHKLGISHLYLSPILQSVPGSNHGYDVLDHHRIDPELGTEQAMSQLCESLRGHGLSMVLDIVPNHMAIVGGGNAKWNDVLENGPNSRFAWFFDIDWDSPEPKLRNKVLLPVLGDHYGRILDSGEIAVQRKGSSICISYHEHRLPLCPESIGELLRHTYADSADGELARVADALCKLPSAGDAVAPEKRHEAKSHLYARLDQLLSNNQTMQHLDTVLEQSSADPELLDSILNRQYYRLAYWRTSGNELNYRRFFNINTLVGIRMEDQRVFEDTHRLILKYVEQGCATGLRVDHPDGLYDPQGYLDRLHQAAPQAWIVLEKIKQPTEMLRAEWPVAGTCGYGFLNEVGGLFVDPASVSRMTELYEDFTGESSHLPEVIRAAKVRVLEEFFGGEVSRLVHHLMDVAQHHRESRDFTRHEMTQAVKALLVGFSVYRTYVRPGSPLSSEDEQHLDRAIRDAAEFEPVVAEEVWDFLSRLLRGHWDGEPESDWVMRFQQMTGPLMAKGVEDTVFYRFNRLISLNEVGSDPGRFGTSVQEFHEANQQRQVHWPTTMLTTSTHDTKRGEDTRLRISMLSEMPELWARTMRRWSELNESFSWGPLPDRNMEYFYYQSLVGAWPIDTQRMQDYMLKAAREAQVYTSWSDPQPSYEDILLGFVSGTMDSVTFTADLQMFLSELIPLAQIHSLSQALLKYTSPGVPDTYRGCELWDLNLVDPDNRRPVDYDLRRTLLDELAGLNHHQIVSRMDEGLPKLYVMNQALRLRNRIPKAFGPDSTYTPLNASGTHAERVVAFGRNGQVMVVAPRLLWGLKGDWADTRLALPDGRWVNLFTHQAIRGEVGLAELLADFPVGLFVREELA